MLRNTILAAGLLAYQAIAAPNQPKGYGDSTVTVTKTTASQCPKGYNTVYVTYTSKVPTTVLSTVSVPTTVICQCRPAL
jgi:hypothetical protein